METQQKLTGLIKQETKDLVHGFARLNTNNKDHIPLEIIHLILLFYFCFSFNSDKCGKSIEISDDGQSIKNISPFLWSTCAYGHNNISNEFCDSFEIHFKMFCSLTGISQIFGYIESADSTTMTDWNDHVAYCKQKHSGIGLHVWGKTLYLYDTGGRSSNREMNYTPKKL